MNLRDGKVRKYDNASYVAFYVEHERKWHKEIVSVTVRRGTPLDLLRIEDHYSYWIEKYNRDHRVAWRGITSIRRGDDYRDKEDRAREEDYIKPRGVFSHWGDSWDRDYSPEERTWLLECVYEVNPTWRPSEQLANIIHAVRLEWGEMYEAQKREEIAYLDQVITPHRVNRAPKRPSPQSRQHTRTSLTDRMGEVDNSGMLGGDQF